MKSINRPTVILRLIFACLIASAILGSRRAIQSGYAAPSAHTHQSSSRQPYDPPTGIDLDVTFINRTPMYQSYCVTYPWKAIHQSNSPNIPGIPSLCPGTENEKRWPSPGEMVTFTAHIVNKGTDTSPAFDFAWEIDDSQVATGTLPSLESGAHITTTYQWAWAHTLSPDGERVLDDHTVSFIADPANFIIETYESNNSLTDRTNAISFRLLITPAMYDAYNTPVDPIYPYSAEDWLQKQIAAMNWVFEQSTYPTTPSGATDRVRINLIEIASAYPDDNRAHDGGWFVDADYRYGASAYYDPATDIDWGLVHELSHQVSLIDLYAIGAASPNVLVLDRSGKPANIGFAWTNPDLMGGGDISPHIDSHLYSSHTAGGQTSNKGYRNGYYGAYQFDIPLQNYLLIRDNQGNPAPEVTVAFYQRQGPVDWSGNTGIDATPEFTGTTGIDGRVLLTNRSAQGGTTTRTGHVLHDNPFGVVDIIGTQNLFLVQLRTREHEEFFWMDITDFNLAYWAGEPISHTFTISTHIPAPGAPSAPEINTLQIQGTEVYLCWSTGSEAHIAGYKVFRADPPQFEYQLIANLPPSSQCLEDVFTYSGYEGHLYAITAVNNLGLESGFSLTRWVPNLINPASLAITSNNEVILLDPQNGYAVNRLGVDGQYQANLGSVHYHLENSRFMALDANQNLIFSHPGDWYTTRQSVRIADLELNPVLEFGETGSAPGQFQNPAGVAAWGPACTYGGAYIDDDHTLLLAHYDGSTNGTQGEIGVASGITFTTGYSSQGVAIDALDTLTYSSSGNIDLAQGAIEFWLRPDWDGGDGLNYTFFELGDNWLNRMRIMKDGGNNLRFMVWDDANEYGVAYNVSHWQANEWHHIGVTWVENTIALFVDGQMVASYDNAYLPVTSDDTIKVGFNTVWDPFRAQGTIDELRISSLPRIGNSDICNHILVADSGNHRIQAFDAIGNFINTYGSLGSGENQFNNPQGITVDLLGRVLVVDQGNNRIQMLSFDGQTFTHLASISAGFDTPTGIAVDSTNRIYVADTYNNRIAVLDPAGNLLAEYLAPNDGYTGNFLEPTGVVVADDGTILIADTGNRRVVRIIPLNEKLYLPILLKEP